MSSLELYENYEAELDSLLASISHKISNIASVSGERKNKVLGNVERDLREAKDILGSMEMELRSLDNSSRLRIQPKLKLKRDQVERIEGVLVLVYLILEH